VVRVVARGGGADDPVTRLVGTLTGLGVELGAIRGALGPLSTTSPLAGELRELREALLRMMLKISVDLARPDGDEPAQWLAPKLDALAESLKSRDSEAWLAPRLDALVARLAETLRASAEKRAAGGTGDLAPLLAQVRRIEQSLGPIAGAAAEQREGDNVLANKMVQIIELLEQLDARLTDRASPR
jgi:hypothetical protein